jgi:hypothetical protein
MRRILLFAIVLTIILTGCNDMPNHIILSGESDSWVGEYKANKGENWEEGRYTFTYKNGGSDTEFSNIEILIGDEGSKSSLKEKNSKGAIFTMSTGCSGCAVTDEDSPIEVSIIWEDGNSETFFLKNDGE